MGQNILNVDNTYGFLGGDHVIIINMMGPDAGDFQYNFIESVSEGQLEMQEPLSSNFSTDMNARAQVLKIFHYDQLTVNGVVTCEPWDGSVGGVIPIYAEESIVINDNGKIEANYKGFAGGTALTAWGVGNQGASSLSLGTNTYLANGSGGGGGNAEWCHSGQGGGGGGFVFAGQNGGAPCWQCGGGWSVGDCSMSGFGGAVIQDLTGVYLGSGGGAGGQDGDNPDGGGQGGSGGGIVLLHSPLILGEGVIESRGQDGNDGWGETGGGGGGSGGTIHLFSTNVAVASLVDGGNGGKQGDARFGGNGSPGLSELFDFVPVSNVDVLWSTGDTTNTIAPLLQSSQWLILSVSRNGFECEDSIFIQVQPNDIPLVIMNTDSLGICGESHVLSTDITGYDLVWNNSIALDSIEVDADSWQTVVASEGVCSRMDSIWISFLNPRIQAGTSELCQGTEVLLSNLGDWNNYIEDSMSVIDSNWNLNTYTVVNGDSVLGPFANVDLRFQSNLPEHDSVEVSFDIYPHDTWDYSEPFEIYVNDVMVATALFNSGGCSNTDFVYQGCANGYCASTATCYPYYRYTYRWADEMDSVSVRINQYGGQDLCDESWSLDNFIVSVYNSKPLLWSNSATSSSIAIEPDTSSWIYLTMTNSLISCVDSIYLTVNPVDTTWLTEILPSDSVYVLGTQLISTPGDYTEVFVSMMGCDSIVNLHLEHTLLCNVQLSADSICEGSMLGVNAVMSGGFSSGFTWSINQVQNTASLIEYPQVDTAYILTVMSGNQTCIDTAFAEVSPATLYYMDADLDGYGAGMAIGFCADPGVGYTLNALDCEDSNSLVNPLGIEVCSNGWDDDCMNGDLDCADTGPGIAIGIPSIGQWGTGVQTNINVNQNLGVNDIQSDGDGVDIWYQFVAQTNAVRIAYRGSLTLGDDNRLMLYDQNLNYAEQWFPLITEDDVHPGAVGSLSADGGSEILYFDQLSVGETYYICIQNTNNVFGTGLLTVSYLYGSSPDIMPYTSYTGVYSNTCQNFKARYRPNAYQYTVHRWTSSNIVGTPSWSFTIPNMSYASTGVASTVCQLGKIASANLSGITQYLNISVDVTYQLKDAFGNNNLVFARANASGLVGLASEQDLFVRTTDQCPVFKSHLYGTLATNRSVCGTIQYDWSFAMQSPAVSLPVVVSGPFGGSRILSLPTLAGIANGQRYDVKIKSKHSDNVSSTNWGSIKCIRTFGSAGMPLIEEDVTITEYSANGITSNIYPNPNSGNGFVLNVNGMEGRLNVKITDATGKLIQLEQYHVEGTLSADIHFYQPLCSGMYLVELTNGIQRQTLRLVVNR
jgi:hypothetical protein